MLNYIISLPGFRPYEVLFSWILYIPYFPLGAYFNYFLTVLFYVLLQMNTVGGSGELRTDVGKRLKQLHRSSFIR